jgi:hypothetical protein
MSNTPHHKTPKLKGLASVGAICAAAGLLAACGGSSSPQHTKTQTARLTPAVSGADAGTARVHTTAPERSGSSPSASASTAAPRSHTAAKARPPAVTSTGVPVRGPGQVSKSVQAHVAPSSEERTRTAVANTFNPCGLVSLAEAQSITGGAISGRIEAPLGPTCIYVDKGSNQRITLAIESLNFSQVTRQLAKRRTIVVHGRNGYCGRLGMQMLFVQLPAHRALNVVAPCGVAQRFAAVALNRLAA